MYFNIDNFFFEKVIVKPSLVVNKSNKKKRNTTSQNKILSHPNLFGGPRTNFN